MFENRRLLLFLSYTNQISITEIAQKTERGLTATKERISKLKSKGILERIGSNKGGYWKVIEKIY
jgi:ATP-dependent DNA helicase RecG